MKRLLSLLLFCNITISFLLAQPVHQVKGTVIDKSSRQPLEFINVMIVGLNKGGVTNAEGKFSIGQVPPGIYRLQASAIGYKTVTTPEYMLSTRDLHIQIEMEENQTELEGVTVTASPFRRDIESPVSLRIIGLQEIEKSPGANRDISRIVQSYPGVAFSPIGYRNDLIVRGGSPSENRFYLDGVEIPNINHFSTQGASGGPVGILNADLIREVNFYTGAFPTDKGNALSSVLDFKLRDGDMERNSLKATLGASEVSLASNGHLGKKTSYLVSVRQSYLQFLFDMLGLPFLPTFTDAQFKLKTRFDARNELTVLGLGGIDKMKLNTKADDEDNEYILSYLPKIQQETFTLGAVYRHYAGAHVQSVVASHSYLNNRNTKYQQNDESDPDRLMLRLRSTEQNTQLRLENSSSFRNWKVTVGTSLDYSQYSNTTFQKVYTDRAQTFDYHTYLGIMRWGLFGTVNYTSIDERFTASLGLRADANNYSAAMKDLSDQLSPRLSLSYQLTEHWSLSGNAGLYYQLPPYTALGFKNNNGLYANKYALRYMQVSQGSVGLNWRKGDTFEVSVEGFYKDYDKIPLSVADGIPLTCKGNDYGVIGNELLTSTAQGRSYGAELLLKWLVAKKLNLASSFTLFKSEYRTDKESEYIASAWDNRFIFNLRGTYNLPRHWSVGMKVSCIGGAPYTPYDADKSSLVTAWNAQGKPYYDYTRYNEERLPAFTQVDIRIDKTFYLKRCMLGFYIDLQNIAGSKLKQADVLMSTGVIKNPDAPIAEQRYVMKSLKQESGTLLPTLGITFEY
ncbi:TonB-dependent receptor [Bacteroides thetaiotaomicron]|jgi:outer membrane receptor for ferrienterochelin and colicin|uniref:TonB-dependent receptor n=1 Tax=Bacteroides thetaiotaomicron TaxID=818 RepID=UPI0008B115D4|nr:TonB-dependent receptor [Bacteroides thetaiotaomicron]MCA6002775.1 TonB-dependent receptor [Bacteroides thetaiotaomicron]MCF2629423.1 TonB-dependent receptor [Bacteroides thetaiotaomicron]MCS3357542.1 TonB-dependent receptor [Bacteroides thetaiotaomicron]UVS52825.1 TonB-dependent receptor [Bacteroides thetaiotaomicron]WOG42826.1 TonB-dependent receptor [Bacteroides thetaiotaomicron]